MPVGIDTLVTAVVVLTLGVNFAWVVEAIHKQLMDRREKRHELEKSKLEWTRKRDDKLLDSDLDRLESDDEWADDDDSDDDGDTDTATATADDSGVGGLTFEVQVGRSTECDVCGATTARWATVQVPADRTEIWTNGSPLSAADARPYFYEAEVCDEHCGDKLKESGVHALTTDAKRRLCHE